MFCFIHIDMYNFSSFSLKCNIPHPIHNVIHPVLMYWIGPKVRSGFSLSSYQNPNEFFGQPYRIFQGGHNMISHPICSSYNETLTFLSLRRPMVPLESRWASDYGRSEAMWVTSNARLEKAIQFSLSLLRSLFFEPSCHVVRKPRPHAGILADSPHSGFI